MAVPAGRCEDPVRTYTSFTSGVEALRDWLIECGIKSAAMESTGNYWITLYDVLTWEGLDVYLVNARHVRGVPGKKSLDDDASDGGKCVAVVVGERSHAVTFTADLDCLKQTHFTLMGLFPKSHGIQVTVGRGTVMGGFLATQNFVLSRYERP